MMSLLFLLAIAAGLVALFRLRRPSPPPPFPPTPRPSAGFCPFCAKPQDTRLVRHHPIGETSACHVYRCHNCDRTWEQWTFADMPW